MCIVHHSMMIITDIDVLEAKVRKERIQEVSPFFPVSAVVKNPPANAGDMGSSPGPGRSHMPRSS